MIIKILAYSVGGTIVVVNIIFIIFGIKTFSKKTHSLLVLGLGIADGLHGVSVLGFADYLVGNHPIINVTDEYVLQANGTLCFLQVLLYYVSIGLSLTVLLFISVERFITVKNFNFIKGSLTMRRKCITIACTITFNLGYIFTWVLTTPIKVTRGKHCTITALYDDPIKHMHGWAIVMLYLTLIGANVALYGRTIRILWKIFRKASMHSEKRKLNMSVTQKGQLSPTTSKDPIHNPSIIGERKESLWKLAKSRVMQSRVSFKPTVHPENPYTSHMSIEINIEQTVKPETRRRITSTSDKKLSFRARQRRMSTAVLNPWERRAMITNCYLIIDHMVFLMPFICILIADLLQASVPVVVWRFAVFWMMLHFLINPFIFAWRVKEVHTEMRKILRCSSQVAPDLAKFSFKGR